MQAIPRWRNLLNLKAAIIQSTTITSKVPSCFADFHSTSNSHEKWKAKWNPDSNGQKPSKDYARYKVRQKRADTKKALKDLLFHGGSLHINFEAEEDTAFDLDQADHMGKKDRSKSSFASRRAAKAQHRRMKREYIPHQAEEDTAFDLDQADHMGKKDRSKSSFASRRAAKAQHRRMKRKYRKEKYEEAVDLENVFRASFGKKWCTWAYWSTKDFSYESSTGFEWKEPPNSNYRRRQKFDNESDKESDDEPCGNTMLSEREALGLPLNGPLKIEDIKTAFRSSAMKWHPDKHQGPSQAKAEERFKVCVDAYKSLCSSLSTA